VLGRRTAQVAKVRWVWRMTDTAYRVYMEHRRPIWGMAVAVLAAVSLFVGFRYAQSRYTASSLQDALQRADGRTLLSMCFERERSLAAGLPQTGWQHLAGNLRGVEHPAGGCADRPG